MEKTNLVEVLMQLLGPRQQQALSFNELAGLLGLVDLLGILNLLHGNAPVQAGTGNAIQEALNAVMSQASGGSMKPPAELAGLLGKNPALLASLMNLLMSMGSKENKPTAGEAGEAGDARPAGKDPPSPPGRGHLRSS